MHDKEISFFVEGFKLAESKFHVDAINKFKELVEKYPDSDLADDALFNIGLCNYCMNQFNQCIKILTI